MTPCLQDLSFDILHQIAPYLNAREYTSLSLSSKSLRRHLQDNGTARKTLQAHHSHTPAIKHALTLPSPSPHHRTLTLLHSRREALRTARPYSITHIATATSFLYTASTLAYTTPTSIRLLDLSSSAASSSPPSANPHPNSTERVISHAFLTSKLPLAPYLAPSATAILAYSAPADILVVLATYSVAAQAQHYLLVLRTRPGAIRRRCVVSVRLRGVRKLWCVLDTEGEEGKVYLFYGTHSARSEARDSGGGDGWPEWLVQGFELPGEDGADGDGDGEGDGDEGEGEGGDEDGDRAREERRAESAGGGGAEEHGDQEGNGKGKRSGSSSKLRVRKTAPFQLRNLSGGDRDSTVTFTLHKGRFLAVTNQTGEEVGEEVGWTSYYRYVGFELRDVFEDDNEKVDWNGLLKVRTVYRRQDHEGPINDSWTELRWVVGEGEGEGVLVEGRREWVDGLGEKGAEGWRRTWYALGWDNESTRHGHWVEGEVSVAPGDPLAGMVRRDGEEEGFGEVLTRWEKGEGARATRGRWCHREGRGEGKEYIRAKTKFSSYDFNRGCCVELVVDDVPPEDGGWRMKERLRLRVVSRFEDSPLVHEEGCGLRKECELAGRGGPPGMILPKEKNSEDVEFDGTELRFKDSEIHLWPAYNEEGKLLEKGDEHVWAEIQELMCPGGRTVEVKGMLGEEGIVYSVGPPGPNGEKRLLFISFEPSWGFAGMRGLDGLEVKPRREERMDWSSDVMTAMETGKGKRKADTEYDISAELPDCPAKRQRSESGSPVSPMSTPPAAVLAPAPSQHEEDFPQASSSTANEQKQSQSRNDSGVADLSDTYTDLEVDCDDLDLLTPPALQADSPVDISAAFGAPTTSQLQSTEIVSSSEKAAATQSSNLGSEVMLSLEEAMYLSLRHGFWVR